MDAEDNRKWLARRYAVRGDDGCWIWLGKPTAGGYGRANRGGRYVAAHRAVYEAHRGRIPDGLELDHLCAVRMCVNPKHLEVVTHAENLRRARARHPHLMDNLHAAAAKARDRRAVSAWHRARLLHRARTVTP